MVTSWFFVLLILFDNEAGLLSGPTSFICIAVSVIQWRKIKNAAFSVENKVLLIINLIFVSYVFFYFMCALFLGILLHR